MGTKMTIRFLIGIVFINAVLGVVLYPRLPEWVASHWNASGEVDGYMSKFWGVFLMPLVMAGMVVFYWVLPKIDPRKENIEQFRKFYNLFWAVVVLFLFGVFLMTLFWNLGYWFDLASFMFPAFAVLFLCLGGYSQRPRGIGLWECALLGRFRVTRCGRRLMHSRVCFLKSRHPLPCLDFSFMGMGF